ncbi:MAG: class I SAM-dependent methyltransferase [Planctomycetota bacterium]
MSAAHTPAQDPAEFKAAQRQAWGDAAAGWRTWWRVFEGAAQGLNERIVDLAEIRAGSRVLDVATGIGEPALTAARRVGRAGSVLATDLAPEMLAFAAERAAELDLSNVALREMDAESLELEPGSFDAATSRWGLMLFADPLAAARGVRRALKPGGRFAAAVWGRPERVPFLAIPHQIAARVLGDPPPPPGAPGAFALAADGALESVMTRAELRDVRTEILTVAFEFASSGEYARFLGDLSATMRKALAEKPADVQARILAEVERESARHALPDGRIRLVNEVRCVSGAR